MPDPRHDPDYLEDICEAMRRIAQYTAEMTYEGFLRETIVQDAVVRNLTIVGEAANSRRAGACERFPCHRPTTSVCTLPYLSF